MDILNMIFTVVFTVEMIIKLLALRAHVRLRRPVTSEPWRSPQDPALTLIWSFLGSTTSSIRGIPLML